MSRLAQRGFTAPRAAIDGRYGLLDVYAGASAQPQHLCAGLGEEWAMDGLWVKIYPICGWIQGVVQLLTAMRESKPMPLERVRKVIVGTSAFAVKNNANAAPADTMDAQYSIPYCVAVALSGDPTDPSEFSVPAIDDAARRAFAKRVELRVDAECEAVYPARFGSRIELHLEDGSVQHAATLDPHGTAADPCTEQELTDKIERLAALSVPAIDAAAIVRAASQLDTTRSVRDLTALLRP
jgi:2-methylcitrate dehydratase PrpD